MVLNIENNEDNDGFIDLLSQINPETENFFQMHKKNQMDNIERVLMQFRTEESDAFDSIIKSQPTIHRILATVDSARNNERRHTQEQVENVRNMTFRTLLLEDLERPGGIRELYSDLHIKPDEVQLHLDGKIAEFNDLVSRGVYVFAYDEQSKHQKDGQLVIGESVSEQMTKDLSRGQKDDGSTYLGFCLIDEKKINSPIQGFVTLSLPPTNKDLFHSYKQKMSLLLQNGVAEGGILPKNNRSPFFDPAQSEIFLRTASIDTIGVRLAQGANSTVRRKVVPHVANRLFAEVTSSVNAMQQIDFLLLYRLSSLWIEHEANDIPVNVGENFSSQNFFVKRGCSNFCYDYNENGPASTMSVEGTEYQITPAWIWMLANWKTVCERSQQLWKDVNESYIA